ncbi:MAG: SHD1 domain-containing protein [Pirellulaceae bacterium]
MKRIGKSSVTAIGCLATLAIGILMCSGMCNSLSKTPSLSNTSSSRGSGERVAERKKGAWDDIEYQIDAEKAVKPFLKYPLDATFNPGWLNVPTVTRSGKSVGVRGTVKAKNAFGAELTYTYGVMYVEEGNTVRRTGVLLDEEFVWVDESYVEQLGREKTEKELAERLERTSRSSRIEDHAKRKTLETTESPTKKTEPNAEEPAKQAKPVILPEAEYRTWSTSDGKFSVDAQFVKMDAGMVVLKRKDTGVEVKVDPNTLCSGDVKWFRDWLAYLKKQSDQ